MEEELPDFDEDEDAWTHVQDTASSLQPQGSVKAAIKKIDLMREKASSLRASASVFTPASALPSSLPSSPLSTSAPPSPTKDNAQIGFTGRLIMKDRIEPKTFKPEEDFEYYTQEPEKTVSELTLNDLSSAALKSKQVLMDPRAHYT